MTSVCDFCQKIFVRTRRIPSVRIACSKSCAGKLAFVAGPKSKFEEACLRRLRKIKDPAQRRKEEIQLRSIGILIDSGKAKPPTTPSKTRRGTEVA